MVFVFGLVVVWDFPPRRASPAHIATLVRAPLRFAKGADGGSTCFPVVLNAWGCVELVDVGCLDSVEWLVLVVESGDDAS